MSTATTVTVTGMSCGGCANSVREEIGRIAGVEAVTVDLPTGRVTVDGSAERATIAAAIGRAGYSVTD